MFLIGQTHAWETRMPWADWHVSKRRISPRINCQWYHARNLYEAGYNLVFSIFLWKVFQEWYLWKILAEAWHQVLQSRYLQTAAVERSKQCQEVKSPARVRRQKSTKKCGQHSPICVALHFAGMADHPPFNPSSTSHLEKKCKIKFPSETEIQIHLCTVWNQKKDSL